MSARKLRAHWIALAACLALLMAPAIAQADFGIKSLETTALDSEGNLDLQAGSHPYEFKLGLVMNQDGEEEPEGTLRDLIVDLPAGFAGNPLATQRCKTSEFEGQNSLCPGPTQVGVAVVSLVGFEGPLVQPIYNLTAPLGVAARLGFSLTSLNSFLEGSLNPANNYGIRISDLTVPSSPTIEIQSVVATVWGDPTDESHDAERQCVVEGKLKQGCPADRLELPFVSLPTSCAEIPETTVKVDSLESPGAFEEETVPFLNEEGKPAQFKNCGALPFKPQVTTQPETSVSDSATGLHVGMEIPQDQTPDQVATAHLKDVRLTLPAGLAVNPSSGDGLAACPLVGPEGINLPAVGTGESSALESAPAKCPAASKVGTVSIQTPLLGHPVPGSVFLARQGENPFGSLIALYIALHDPISGVVVKIAGKAEPDPVTGQIRATFENNPQLPFEKLDFDFTGGPRATLTTPFTCGPYTASTQLTPWSAPEGKTATKSSAFPITSAPGGGGCATSEAQAPNAPAFEAGTATPLAGTYSPFVLKLSRENGSQHFAALNMTLPKGVSAKFASVAECSEGQIAQAQARSNLGEGALEKASPSCPAASEVGTVNVGAGSGSPLYVQGRAYLAGPYKGAPFSIVVVSPAIAGPFDLGTVVVRSALFVNEETAQGTIVTDPLPTILAGIPLDIRSVAIHISRDQFTLNPTSCEPMAVTGQSISTTGAVAALSNRFQVGGCRGLGFSPKIALSFQGKGATQRRAHPSLKAVITRPEGQANFGRVSVMLPSTQFIDPNHVGNPCTRPKFAEEKCPKISELGTVTAYTPLLDKPLKGKVYFRANGGVRKLPDIVADLKGQVHFVLVGFVDAVVNKRNSELARVRTTFAQNPDAPVSKVVLQLFGGKRGTLVNSQNLCKTKVPQSAVVKMSGQNGKAHNSQPKIANSCPKKK